MHFFLLNRINSIRRTEKGAKARRPDSNFRLNCEFEDKIYIGDSTNIHSVITFDVKIIVINTKKGPNRILNVFVLFLLFH